MAHTKSRIYRWVGGFVAFALTVGGFAQTTGSSSGGLVLRTSFAGLDDPYAPASPDVSIAAGPSTIILVRNNIVAVRDKTGATVDTAGLNSFFHSVLHSGEGVTDPFVLFDKVSARFFLVTSGTVFSDPNCAPGSCIADYLLAVSKSAAPQTLTSTDWWFYAFDRTLDQTTPTTNWGDFDHLATTNDALVIVCNMYSFRPSGTPGFASAQGVKIRILDKAKLIRGERPASWIDITLRDPVTGATIQGRVLPALQYENRDTVFLVTFAGTAVTLAGPCAFGVWRLEQLLSTPALTFASVIPSTCPATGSGGVDALQPSGGSAIDVAGVGFNSPPVYRNGSLWIAATARKSTTNGDRDVVRFSQVDVSSWPTSPSLVQDSLITSGDLFQFSPAIMVDSANDVAIVYERSGTSELVSTYVAERLGSDPPNFLRPSVLLQPGATIFNHFESGRNRFNDYVGGALDPADDGIWLIGMYPKSETVSGTWVGNVILQPESTLGGQAFPGTGGTGVISFTLPVGYSWSAFSLANWITFTGPTSGIGGGSVNFQVFANSGPARSATIMIAGLSFAIEQQAASIPGLSFVGSMPHIAAEENWTTTFTLVNKSTTTAQARFSLFGDPNGLLALPLTFPQQSASPLPLLAASLDRTLSGNASLIINTAGPQTPPVQVGSAQLAATGAVDGFAIFHLIPGAQEAVVPMETRNASSYLLAFDSTNGVVLGVAVGNVSAQPANIAVVIRDDTGAQIGTGSLALAGSGHTSFVLSTQFPVTANKRGTVEFDTPPGGQISALGIRFTPPNFVMTTIPVLANVGTSGGSIAHIATGNGWQTTFVLVNAGASAAQAHLKFFADDGSALSLPLSFPQSGGGAATVASTVDRTLAAGATLIVQSAAPLTDPLPTIGSAQLTASGNVSGFVIFRYNLNGQGAVVPLESRNANAYILAFDNTSGTATGVAINSVSSQTANVPVVIRDDTGAQIATDTLTLAANGHLAFTLVADKYPATANIRGTIEFDTPLSGQIGALGIRVSPALTFTTLPALVK